MENFFTQQESNLNGRKVWRYLAVTPIGNINIVQYECKTGEAKTFLYLEQLENAEKKYRQLVKGILNDKL